VGVPARMRAGAGNASLDPMFVPLTPLRCLRRATDLFGSKIGVVSGDREFTYREFGARCDRLAGGLIAEGVRPGDRIAYLSFNNHELLEGYYGVVQAGAIVMPLNVRLSAGELAAILQHSEARLLIFEAEFAPLAEKLRPACPSVERWVVIGAAHGIADMTYEELLDRGQPHRADILKIDEMSTAELFYTSGSTGTPKGVEISHRALYMHALSVANLCREPETMVDLHTIPLFHANGWGRPQCSFMLGTKQVMVRRFDPAVVFGLIERHRATDMSLVPTMANALLHFPEATRFDRSSMRAVMIGGAASSPLQIERLEAMFPNALCFAGYGLTETTPVVAAGRSKHAPGALDDDERRRRQSMAGWPVLNVELRVVDLYGNGVPRDGQTIGEVLVLGDHVMEGYYREPAATRAVMEGGWFHTGDMAVWDEEGYVHIVDRKKEIIISGGENISSIEVERAIYAHPDVVECAVVAAPDPTWGEVPAALVVLKQGSTLKADALRAFLAESLGRFKLPHCIEFSTDPLPKTGTGKIRKIDIKNRFWAGKERRVQGA
jgi:fatty-acyl-CoA synthase